MIGQHQSSEQLPGDDESLIGDVRLVEGEGGSSGEVLGVKAGEDSTINTIVLEGDVPGDLQCVSLSHWSSEEPEVLVSHEGQDMVDAVSGSAGAGEAVIDGDGVLAVVHSCQVPMFVAADREEDQLEFKDVVSA